MLVARKVPNHPNRVKHPWLFRDAKQAVRRFQGGGEDRILEV